VDILDHLSVEVDLVSSRGNAHRIRRARRAWEVLATSTVRDLVAGSGIVFADRGQRELKGAPGM
jgi:hypothetical protein